MNPLVPYIDLLIKLISIPAASREEAQRADFLEKALEGMGHGVERVHNNLVIGRSNRKEGRINLLLNSHLDTVLPVEGWERDPYTPLREGERITGLGSNDAGASVVALIAAYREMAPRLQGAVNLTLLISAEEEISGDEGISAVLPGLEKMDAVIVGEPTGMKPAVAERGLMVLDGKVTGKAGHAGRNEGENAIYKAMRDIGAMASLSFSEHSDWLPDPGVQVTMISGGTGHNVVPDVCRYVVDVRSNDRYGNERMLEIISGVCQAELVPRSTRLKPSTLERGHLLMRTLFACGLEPFGSSTLSDMALIPYPAIKMGPGDSARSHTAGEHILISELKAGVEGYCKFLSTMGEIVKKNSTTWNVA
jgi:acetylornithine deacetylase